MPSIVQRVRVSTGCSAGLFLHVGLSVKDRHVIEANTPVAFRADSVADKLGTLLNEDSAEQVPSVAPAAA